MGTETSENLYQHHKNSFFVGEVSLYYTPLI